MTRQQIESRIANHIGVHDDASVPAVVIATLDRLTLEDLLVLAEEQVGKSATLSGTRIHEGISLALDRLQDWIRVQGL